MIIAQAKNNWDYWSIQISYEGFNVISATQIFKYCIHSDFVTICAISESMGHTP